MGQNLIVLALMLLATFSVCSDAESAVYSKSLKQLSPDTPFGPHLVTESKEATGKRHLRTHDKATSQYDEEDRDVTAASVVTASVKAIRMKAKLNIMLARGLSPARVLEKLEVVRMTDKNFNNFARYYAKYLDKYASKKPDLPKTAEDAILLPKLKEWVGQKLLSSQVKHNLKDLASTNINRYIQLYLKEADNAIILPMLERWVGQKILPSQVKYNLHEIGVTDTTKYVEWYMRNGGDDVVMAKLQKWFNEDVGLAQIAPKLEKIGVTDTAKYVGWYGNALVMGMLRGWVNRGLAPPQIISRLQQLGVPNIETYAQKCISLWGKRQAELSRDIN